MPRWHVKVWASAPGDNPERVLWDATIVARTAMHAASESLQRAAKTYEPPFRIVSLVRVDPPADHVS